MAKSGRSKIKRANRALKREKNAKKERVKLEKMVEQARETLASQTDKKVYTVLGAVPLEQEEAMVVDGEETEVKPAKSTTENEDGDEMPMGVGARRADGSFPVWMNKRAVKRAKAMEKKKARQKSKGKRAGSRPWRK